MYIEEISGHCGFLNFTDQMDMGHSKNNEATQKYCLQGIYSAVVAYS